MATTRGTKIIYNFAGDRLRLSDGKLNQIDHPATKFAWYVTAADFREAYRDALQDELTMSQVRVHQISKEPFSLRVSFTLPHNKIRSYEELGIIGCAKFSPEVFKLIVRRFKARKTQARGAKAGA